MQHQKKKDLTPKEQIKLLSEAYVRSQRIIYETECGYYDYPAYKLDNIYRIVKHIDTVIDSMDKSFEKLILENEIKQHRTGEWYKEYCSQTTYYRLRDKAYEHFINEVNK